MHTLRKPLLPLLFLLFLLTGCASAYRQVAGMAIGFDRERAGLERKEVTLDDGLRYVYLEGGTGEPLMLLHGFGGNKDNFTRSARHLTPQYRVIIPDHIGFGESSRPADADYTPSAQAERLHRLAKALGIRNVHFGGNSMGGQIAMAYVAMYPDDVGSLWLLNPAGIWNAPRSELADIVLGTGRNPLIARSEEEFAETFAFVMTDPPFVPRPILNVFAQERIRNADLEERIFAKIATDSVEQRVTGLQTPTLIVWGDGDRVIHVGTAEVLHKLMPRSQVVVMPGVGHLPMIERPKESAEDYLRFRAAVSEGK
ncbi:alpha/beta fold hydrolase [Noviherbaspirillum sp. ST9]|uniref:alpha/beta fold hydrolase n=1 Tax=Noviherbaspirillum sp. ST9 TaxID=3401606 RepID=UPI003B588ECE